ncbi:uncharacterized protein LOC106013763, partial [Aplysia californica]|uniref:Uncharacterized protein LOC106013763 n=1 Tax=Aplysia californica TaxID=6500 RepID=A0ABM1ADW1_APLCA
MNTSGGPSTSTTSTPSTSTAACPSRSDGDTQTNDGKKKEWMKLDSDDRWMEMDSVKYQAGSCLALISLLAADKLKTRLWVPDEMVRLDTDSMEQLAQGKLPGRKRRKPPVADSEAPKGKNQIVLTRPAQKKAKLAERNQGLAGSEDSSSEQMSSEPSSSSARGPAFSTRMEDKYEEKAVVTENVDLSYRCLKSDECHFLNDYAVWLASGSLLTLARQAVIDKLDIQSNKFLFHQRFSVDNVYLRFRLREGSTDGLEMLKEWRGVEVEEEPWSLRLGTGHHRLRNTTSEENSKETPTSSAKVASFSTPAGSSSRNAEDSEMEVATSGKISILKTTKSAPSSDDTPTAKRKEHKGRSDLTPTPGEASADKLFKEVIEGLETVFTPEFLKTDVEADIARCLPPGLVEKGRVLVSVVDQFGVRGALDNEIERRMGESVVPLRPLIRRLLKCHALLSVGVARRRYVSRRHSKAWLVWTELPQQTTTAATAAVDAGETSGTGEKRNSSLLFQTRIWRLLSGAINLDCLTKLLHKLVTVLVRDSGCLLQNVCDQLNPDVLPVSTIELVELLEDLGCLTLRTFPKTPKTSLFSPRSEVTRPKGSATSEDCVTAVSLSIHAPVC